MFKPGDYVFSPGGNFLYEICSYPFCRLYFAPGDKFELQPHSFERRLPEHKFNYLSYVVRMEAEQRLILMSGEYEWVEVIGTEFVMTDRCLIGIGNERLTVRKRISDAVRASRNDSNVA